MADNAKVHERLINRFIALANNMKQEGHKPAPVSDAFMSACAVYVTYAVAGNEGGLNESGIKKMATVFEDRLRSVQEMKKSEQYQAHVAREAQASKSKPAND